MIHGILRPTADDGDEGLAPRAIPLSRHMGRSATHRGLTEATPAQRKDFPASDSVRSGAWLRRLGMACLLLSSLTLCSLHASNPPAPSHAAPASHGVAPAPKASSAGLEAASAPAAHPAAQPAAGHETATSSHPATGHAATGEAAGKGGESGHAVEVEKAPVVGPSAVSAGGEGAKPMQAEARQGGQDSLDPALELHGAWNAYVESNLEAFHGAPATLPAAEDASPWDAYRVWIMAGAGLLVGAGLAWLISGLLGRRGRKGEAPKPAAPAGVTTSHQAADIRLVSSQSLAGLGSLLVVDVQGERLVVAVSGDRSSVNLLTKVGVSEPLPDAASAAGLLAARGAALPPAPVATLGASGQSLVEEGVSAPASAAEAGTGEGAPADAELDALLDELLGRVRSFKPLVKRADEV